MNNRRWLGYELSVLRRIKFNSVAIPFSGPADLDWYLKFWGKQIFSNDLCQWSWWTSRALVENQQEALHEEDVAQLLHNTYVPRRRLHNPALGQTMGEMDAWWFDNLWLNIQQIENPQQRALAYYHALGVGDYVHSFTAETVELRRPLSEVFEELWRGQRKVQNNERDNHSSNLEASEFIGSVRTDLLFAHFPRPAGLAAQRNSILGWREIWIRGSATGFDDLLGQVSGFGDRIASKGRYLDLVGKFLENAKHIPKWAIVHPEEGFITAAEMGELIKTFRPVEVTYAKDFSEISGGLNTYIIVA